MSKLITNGRVLYIYTDDVIIYTSAATSKELQLKLQCCVDTICQWYFRNKLTVYKKVSPVMLIWNIDQFSINLESNNIERVNKAKSLGFLVKDYFSWDNHISQLSKNMNYELHVLRRFNKVSPK